MTNTLSTYFLALAGWQLGAAAILGLILLIGVFILITFFSIWLRA